MKQAIVNFCKSMDTGLFLLDMPTGFGKTYSVLDFMVDNYDAPEFKDKKIFFVTTLKKNLPDKELREHFARRGKADDYDKYCLRIEANADMVVQKLDELYRARKIPPTITMKQEFKDLHGSVVKDAEGNINLIKDTNMYSMPDYTAMGDVLKNVASEGRFPGKDVVTWLRLVMDTTDKIKVPVKGCKNSVTMRVRVLLKQ